MPQTHQDHTARRFYTSEFDCELPRNIRNELVAPRRPRILKRPVQEPLCAPSGVPKWLIAFGLLALILLCVVNSRQRERTTALLERAKASQIISVPTPQPQPTPTPAPTPELSPYHDWQSYLAAQQRRAPRAALVKLPPPRAQLISLPEWKVGETRPLTMPYNLEVLATYKGQLGSESMLPAN